MLVNAAAYLVLVCTFILLGAFFQFLIGQSSLAFGFVDDRDLVALFGWVGLTISGVSTIVIPNHVGKRLGPPAFARIHLLLTNVGLLGFLASPLMQASEQVAELFLTVAVASFLLFGLLLVSVLWPFARDTVRVRLPPSPSHGAHGRPE